MRQTKSRFESSIVVMVLSLVLAATGCGGGEKVVPAGLAPVTGVVTLDDKPVVGASVMLIPDTVSDQALDAGGVTDEKGEFVLHSGEGQAPGAKPGGYRVVISKLVKPDGTVATPTPEQSPMELMLAGAKESLHANYSDQAFSKLKTTVPQGGGKLEFKLNAGGT